jgi:ATP adenylyltransferase
VIPTIGNFIVSLNRHMMDIRELSPEERIELDRLLDRSLSALDAVFTPAGYNIGYNMGLVAGASIDHLHLHVIPRYPREIGIAELIGGKRVLVQDPRESLERIVAAFG